MLIKREVIEKVGMMPEIFFLYYEEIDWCTHMRRAGYELWYEPRCTIFHKESQSTGQLSALKTYYMTRNRLLYAWRNLNGNKRYFSIIYQITAATIKNGMSFLLKGRSDLLYAIFKGISSFIITPHKMK